MAFRIIRNDITKVKADAIVNTANPMPVIGGGTDTAIYNAAGKEELLAARKVIGEIAPGDAVETPAFGLDAKYIIHTVGPVWNGGNSGEFDILKSAYENSLNTALKLKCKSIAFPLMAAGSNGFPKDKALQIAMNTIQAFLMEHEMKIILVVFDEKAYQLSGNIINNIKSYVDSHYVDEAHEREHYHRSYNTLRGRNERILRDINFEDKEYLEKAICANQSIDKASIDGITLEPLEKTFQEKLFEIIDARGLTGPQVYNPYISKQVFSKIQCDKDYHPRKGTAISLCLSLHLNINDTNDLLSRAGYVLSPSSRTDMVIRACILDKRFDYVEVNLILDSLGCPILDDIK